MPIKYLQKSNCQTTVHGATKIIIKFDIYKYANQIFTEIELSNYREFDLMQKYRKSFESSELGRLHAMLPLKEMAEQLASAFPKKHPQGNTPMFPPESTQEDNSKN